MDFNASEIILLLVLAIILFGPEKLPELARKTARVLHYVRRIANDAQGRLRQELGPEYADLQLSDLNPKAFIAKHLGPDATDDLNAVAGELRDARTSLDGALTDAGDQTEGGGESEVVAAESPLPPFDTEAT
ncbi:MAG TPA: sec-independent translocase [Micropruina sp.]|nr:Sec-independent protein translocase subunit TatB [Propionibacterium sp.]HMQ36144.1 sec-independent translocase [Micropruina sp.]HMR20853.1 sec-independent translocase [Micropruina sp.]